MPKIWSRIHSPTATAVPAKMALQRTAGWRRSMISRVIGCMFEPTRAPRADQSAKLVAVDVGVAALEADALVQPVRRLAPRM